MKSLLVILLAFATSVEAFMPGPPVAFRSTQAKISLPNAVEVPATLQRQRYSVAQVQTMVFGLGAPEIAVVLVAAAFLLGPQKLAELGKDAGKIAGELKEVPKEFQAGLKEGEQQAQVNKQADVIEAVKDVPDEKK